MSAIQTNNPAFSGTIFGDWERSERRSTVMTVGERPARRWPCLIILVACAAVTWIVADRTDTGPSLADPAKSVSPFASSFAQALVIGGDGARLLLRHDFQEDLGTRDGPALRRVRGRVPGRNLATCSINGIRGSRRQAVSLTFATTACMLFVYATGLIKVTGRLYAVITAGTGALALFYFGSMLLGMFGVQRRDESHQQLRNAGTRHQCGRGRPGLI